jgi:hypothetical protein
MKYIDVDGEVYRVSLRAYRAILRRIQRGLPILLEHSKSEGIDIYIPGVKRLGPVEHLYGITPEEAAERLKP